MKGASLLTLEKVLSRRMFFGNLVKATSIAASLPLIAPKLWAIDVPTPAQRQQAYDIMGAIGRVVIPEDQDPGWATFEPGITQYAFDIYMTQIFLVGDQDALNGIIQAFNHFNDEPITNALHYNVKFLDMSDLSKARYLTDCIIGNFENSGWGDVFGLVAALGVLSTKLTFFSNYPRHLSTRGAEFQILAPSPVKTGWDIMGYKGPVGPDEEKALRAKYSNVQEIPGVDTRNPYI
jgi:hypothetical protein